MESSGYAGVLPDVATAQFNPAKVTRFALPFLKGYVRPLVLTWHPLTAAVREILTPARACLEKLLR